MVSCLPVGSRKFEFAALPELVRLDSHVIYRLAKHSGDVRECVVVFSDQLCQSESFRTAFRGDVERLAQIQHHHIVPLTEWGEQDGQLFFIYAEPDGRSLQELIEAKTTFAWDEVVDVAWQISSAIQHLHNLGLTHGGLSADCIAVAAGARAQLLCTGMHRWIAAASPDAPIRTFSKAAVQDLKDFGVLLKMAFDGIPKGTISPDEALQIKNLDDLIADLEQPGLDFLARDVQGRLGNILLKASGDSMELTDQRKGQGLSRRSLIDELFDDEDVAPIEEKQFTEKQSHTKHFRWWWVAFLVAMAAVAIVIWQICN